MLRLRGKTYGEVIDCWIANAPGDCAGSLILSVMKGIMGLILENQRQAVLYKHVLKDIICMLATDCPSVIPTCNDETADLALKLVQELKNRFRKLEVGQDECRECRYNPPKR